MKKIFTGCVMVLFLAGLIAGCGGGNATGHWLGEEATLTSLAVTPATASIPITGFQQFKATATYSDGSTRDVTTISSWTSGTPLVATVSLTTGVAVGVATGTSRITANFGGLPPASATLTVNAATSVSFVVTPTTASIPVSGTQQFAAIQTFSNGTTFDRTAASAWTSGTFGVASVSNTSPTIGVATGKAVGTSLITATFGSLTPASATLTVNAATSKSFVVTPALASIPVSGTQQYTAIETFSDGTSFDRTAASVWTSGTFGVASISNTSPTIGVATGKAVGTSLITATFGSLTPATATLTVNAATSVSFVLTPVLASIPVTGTQQYTAIETFSDGTTIDRTAASAWTTTDLSGGPNVATISNVVGTQGRATGAVIGTSTITATYTANGITKLATGILTVNAATSKSFVVTPALASIPVTGTQKYTAIETFSDGSTIDRTDDPSCAWTSPDASFGPGVASMGIGVNKSLATGNVVGTATITAKYTVGSITKTATGILTVNAATSKSFVVTPALASIPVSGTQKYTAIETFSDGTTIDRTDDLSCAWTSPDASGGPGVASMGIGVNKSLATGNVVGTATITAKYTVGGITKTATAILTVNAATSKSFVVTPTTASIPVSGTQKFEAIEIFSDGSTINRTAASAWTTTDLSGSGVATIGSHTGLATGAAKGSSTITATYTDVNGLTKLATATLTVTAYVPPGPVPNPLGSARTYGMIASDAMTISAIPQTHIYGDVALINNDSFVGFALTDTPLTPKSIYVTPRTSPGINSKTYGDTAVAVQAQQDLAAAYADLWGRPATTTYPAANLELSGLVITPGVYKNGSTYSLSNLNGPLVLDAQGHPDAVFVFQASAMTTTTGSVVLQGGAQANNVYWVVSSDATIGNGTGTLFQGTVVAGNTITVDTGANVQGRMLAGALGAGAITNKGSVIVVPE